MLGLIAHTNRDDTSVNAFIESQVTNAPGRRLSLKLLERRLEKQFPHSAINFTTNLEYMKRLDLLDIAFSFRDGYIYSPPIV